MPKTPPLLMPTTTINYFESHQQKGESGNSINCSSDNNEGNQNDDQHVLDDDRAWHMLEDQQEVDDHAILSSNSHNGDENNLSLVLDKQEEDNETVFTDENCNDTQATSMISHRQQQQSLDYSTHNNDTDETLWEQEVDNANDGDHMGHQQQHQRGLSLSSLYDSNNNNNNNDSHTASSQLDIATTSIKVNELVQTLVDLMQQTTEDVSEAESVTRSMIEGLKEYRETIATRGNRLEQTWQDIRLYASNIAGHQHRPHQSPGLYNEDILFSDQQEQPEQQQLDSSNSVKHINEGDKCEE